MPTADATSLSLRDTLATQGFAFVHGSVMRSLLAAHGDLSDWPQFADSWNRLELDSYMADGGRYRRRRHAVYRVTPKGPALRLPHQPHVQTLEYNPIHGGVERWFAPVEEPLGEGSTLTTILAFCRDLFGASGLAAASKEGVDPRTGWRVEVHQFRIEARSGQPGLPTPEGLHRDGVDSVLVLLVSRSNIARGLTAIHALDGRPLGSFTLTDPLDAAIVDDTRVAHGVTPVEPIDPALPAYRDVLVVTFKAEG